MSNANHGKRLYKTWTRYVLLLFSLILFTGPITFGADTDDEPQIAPMNSELSTDGGLFESPLSGDLLSDSDTTFPASYDLRTTSKLTPVKNQGESTRIWAFATYGSMESCLLPTELSDFSEEDMMLNTGYTEDPKDSNEFYLAIAYLTRWSGPINQSDAPWNEKVQKHVQEVLHLPDRNKAEIKKAIITYGGVSTGMVMYFSGMMYDWTYNKNHNAYWNFFTDDWKANRTGLNHTAVIVGWDDHYSRTNFNPCPGVLYNGTYYPAGYPSGDGAWIVRDSRGTGCGEEGYFYVSYYDNNFARSLWVFNNAEPVNNYQKKYDYDELGNVTNLGYSASNTAWMSNVFNADGNEPLTAIGTYAQTPNTAYTIQIYTNVDVDTNNISSSPKNGKLASTQTGTFAYAGYHTITLKTPVALTDGQKFSVVIKMTTPGYNYPIPVEANVPEITSSAISEQGQSYISKDGTTWQDMNSISGVLKKNLHDSESTVTICNACIKAYISYAPVITAQPQSRTVDAESNITLTAGVFTMVDTTYQWFYNNTSIPGANSPTLSLNNVTQYNNGGEYYLAATNAWGTKTSNKVTLTVLPLLPDPLLDLQPGTYKTPQNVSVFYPDGYFGVTIRYTTNNTTPTAASPVFRPTTPLKIGAHTILKVRAFKTRYTSSHVITAEYSITGTVAKPAFSLPSGTYTYQPSVRLSCMTSGATIHYTNDGNEPTIDSPVYDPANPISVTVNPTTLKAKAFLADWDNSPTATATYLLSEIAAPTFNVPGGLYSTARNVTIKSHLAGLTIYYTFDGTDPTPPSAGVPAHGKVFSGTAITIARDCTLKAIAYKAGYIASKVTEANYYIGASPAPTFNLASGRTYNATDSITLNVSDATAVIYYTTDGSTPTDQSTVYEQPIQLPKNMIIKARTYKPNKLPSAVVTATYNVYLPVQPIFSVPGGSYSNEQTTVVTCDDADTVIRYTTNGTEPIATSPTIRSGQAIQVKGPSTIFKAKASKTGWAPSKATTAAYKITTGGTVATPTLSPAGTFAYATLPYSVAVACTTSGAVIRYTDDGTTPNGMSKLCEDDVITITGPKTIKVRAFRDGMASSAVASATYSFVLPLPQLTDDGSTNEQKVTINPIVEGAIVRYTVNGTEPTATSHIAVNGEVLVNRSLTLKAKSFKSGWATSPTVTKKYAITQVASPKFSVSSGTYYTCPEITIKCATVPPPGQKVVIYYTFNGGDPTTSSEIYNPRYTISWSDYDDYIQIKAMAVIPGMANSNVTTATYRVTGTVAKPKLYCVSKEVLQSSGTYASGLRVYVPNIPTEYTEIEVHYTTDGTIPTMESPKMDRYILIEKSCTLKVRAFKKDWLPSPVATETYTILKVATPDISITDGSAAINCATPGAVTRYTTNGNEPTESDPVVSAGLQIPIDPGTTLKAKAWKSGLIPSATAIAKTQYMLTVTTDGNGAATPVTPISVNHSMYTTIKATPNPGYNFVKWEKTVGTGNVVFQNPNKADTTVTVTGGDVKVQAKFEPYKLTVETKTYEGKVTPSGTVYYQYGSGQVITAIPNPGYRFLYWEQERGSAGFSNRVSATTTVTIDRDTTIRAVFIPYRLLNILNDGNGTTSPAGFIEVNYGQSLGINATPASGYEFLNWTKVFGDGTVTFGDPANSKTNVTITYGDATIRANFGMVKDIWVPGNLEAGNTKWYCVRVTPGNRYAISWDDRNEGSGDYSCNIKISVYHLDKSTAYFTDANSGFNTPLIVTPTEDYLYIQVNGYDLNESGSFALKCSQL